MASPQIENGYTPVANELFEAFLLARLKEYERLIIMALWRKTYGWSKRWDWVSHTQFEQMTGIARKHVVRTVTALKKQKIILTTGKKLSVNKNWEEWDVEWRVVPLEGLGSPPGGTTTSPPGGTTTSPPGGTHKNNKANIQKQVTPPTVKDNKYIDYETGEVVETKPKTTAKNKQAVDLCVLFEKLGEKHTGVKPDLTRAYFKMLNAMKSHSLSTDDVKSLFTYFFKDARLTPEKKVSIGLCLSGAYITQWRVSQLNRSVTQAEASSEIIL